MELYKRYFEDSSSEVSILKQNIQNQENLQKSDIEGSSQSEKRKLHIKDLKARLKLAQGNQKLTIKRDRRLPKSVEYK